MKKEELRIQLTLTEGQARAAAQALEFYYRTGIGQIEQMAELLRDGTVPMFLANAQSGERMHASTRIMDQVKVHLLAIKALLGYPLSGSHGIGNPANHIGVKRTYEVGKVLNKALTEVQDPARECRTVDHDGLVVRYTDDPAPEASIVTAPSPHDRFTANRLATK